MISQPPRAEAGCPKSPSSLLWPCGADEQPPKACLHRLASRHSRHRLAAGEARRRRLAAGARTRTRHRGRVGSTWMAKEAWGWPLATAGRGEVKFVKEGGPSRSGPQAQAHCCCCCSIHKRGGDANENGNAFSVNTKCLNISTIVELLWVVESLGQPPWTGDTRMECGSEAGAAVTVSPWPTLWVPRGPMRREWLPVSHGPEVGAAVTASPWPTLWAVPGQLSDCHGDGGRLAVLPCERRSGSRTGGRRRSTQLAVGRDCGRRAPVGRWHTEVMRVGGRRGPSQLAWAAGRAARWRGEQVTDRRRRSSWPELILRAAYPAAQRGERESRTAGRRVPTHLAWADTARLWAAWPSSPAARG